MLVLYSAGLKVQSDEMAELTSQLAMSNVSPFFFLFNLNFYHFHELSCLLERLYSTKLPQGSAEDLVAKDTGGKKEEREINCFFQQPWADGSVQPV